MTQSLHCLPFGQRGRFQQTRYSLPNAVNVVYCFQINAVFSLQIRKLSVSLQHETSVTTSKVTDDWRMKM